MTILDIAKSKGSIETEIKAKLHWFNKMSKQGVVNINHLENTPPRSMYTSPEGSPYKIEHDEELKKLNEQMLSEIAQEKHKEVTINEQQVELQ